MITRYFAHSASNRRRALSTGFETEAEARAQARFLADTYGGTVTVTRNDADQPMIARYSTAKGWKEHNSNGDE